MGVVWSPNALLTWGRDSVSIVLVSSPREPQTWDSAFARKPIAASLANNEEFVVLDADKQLEITIPSNGGVVLKAQILFPPFVESAARVGQSWYASTVDADSAATIWRLTAASPQRVDRLRQRGPEAPARDRLVLSSAAGKLLATSRFFPFATYELDRSSALIPRFTPTLVEAPADFEVRRFVTTAVVAVGDVIVQTVSDLAASHRVVIVWKISGDLLTTFFLREPIAIAGYDTLRSAAIAIRRRGFNQSLEWHPFTLLCSDEGKH
jgi:hypothetical protein